MTSASHALKRQINNITMISNVGQRKFFTNTSHVKYINSQIFFITNPHAQNNITSQIIKK